MRTRTGTEELPRWLWLWLPLVVGIAPLVATAIDDRLRRTWIGGETGLVESLTVLFLAIAVAVGIAAVRRAADHPVGWLRWWVLLISAGCFYFGGEEASWGQHYFHWQTPELWSALNKQRETNLHNVSPLFDQLPRNLLSLAALIGGVAIPLWTRQRQLRWDPRTSTQYWLWPTIVCLPAAALALLITLPHKLVKALQGDSAWAERLAAGEIKEVLLALFLLLYLLSLFLRLERCSRTRVAGTGVADTGVADTG